MLAIKSPLDVRTLPDNDKFLLIADLLYFHPLVGVQVVPKGFVTDFASIPKFLRDRFNVNDVHREEAVVHDWLYKNLGVIPNVPKLTRKECDDIFYDGLKKEYPKISKLNAWLFYTSVRLFGGLHLKLTSNAVWE